MIEWILGEESFDREELKSKLEKINNLLQEEVSSQPATPNRTNKSFSVIINGEVIVEEKGDPLIYMEQTLTDALKQYTEETGIDPQDQFPYLSSVIG